MTYVTCKMYQFLLIFMVLCEASCSNSPVVAKNRVYSMPLVRRKSPLHMLLKDPSYMKKMNIPKIYKLKSKPTNENVTLFKYLDSEYYADITVGKPGQPFTVIFDTTWGDMWLPSKLCSQILSPVCSTKNLYNGDVSSTHKAIDPKPFDVAGLVGNLTCDTVRLAHLNVTDLVFAEIRKFPDQTEYPAMHADGVIGLGYNTLARTTSKTFFYKLLADKKISKPTFSVYINRDHTTPKGGMIYFGGGIEPKHMKGEVTYVPVTRKQYWQIAMKQFSVQLNKTKSHTFCTGTCQVILDTGSNKIGVPKEYVVAINNLIGATEYLYNRFVVPCLQIPKLPTVTIQFGNKNIKMVGRHYIQQMENGTSGMICMSAFCNAELEGGMWSLGGAFLSSVFTIFDLENNQVGFADLKSNY